MALERLARKFGVNVETEDVKIAYKETIARKIEVEGKLNSSPAATVSTPSRCSGSARRRTVRAASSSTRSSAARSRATTSLPSRRASWRPWRTPGAHGFPVVDVRVEAFDGKAHSVDSSDMAFRTAAALGLKEAMAKAGTVVLEPISMLTVTVPVDLQGDVMASCSSRRGRIAGTDVLSDGRCTIQAMVPEAEITRYVLDLRSLTGGRGSFTAAFDHYDILPSHLVDKLPKPE